MKKNMNIMVMIAILFAAFFQLIPVIFSESIIFATILSTVPIYVVTRKNIVSGFITFIAVSILTTLINQHEGMLFIFTNGLIGISLGIINYYTQRRSITNITMGILLTLSLCFLSYAISIPVFGTELLWNMNTQVGFIFLFSIVYTTIINYLLSFIYSKLKIE